MSKRTRMTLVLVALGLGGLAALYLGTATHANLKFSDHSFEVISPTRSTATVDISKDAGATVQCEVRALNESYAIVGWKTLVVGPTEGNGMTTTRFDVPLRTESLATTAGIEECRILKAS